MVWTKWYGLSDKMSQFFRLLRILLLNTHFTGFIFSYISQVLRTMIRSRPIQVSFKQKLYKTYMNENDTTPRTSNVKCRYTKRDYVKFIKDQQIHFLFLCNFIIPWPPIYSESPRNMEHIKICDYCRWSKGRTWYVHYTITVRTSST